MYLFFFNEEVFYFISSIFSLLKYPAEYFSVVSFNVFTVNVLIFNIFLHIYFMLVYVAVAEFKLVLFYFVEMVAQLSLKYTNIVVIIIIITLQDFYKPVFLLNILYTIAQLIFTSTLRVMIKPIFLERHKANVECCKLAMSYL